MDDTAPASADAIAANTRAFAHHRAGRYAEAAAGFAAAVAAAPGFLLARYNLACARARLGELDDAARELSFVLERDLLDVRDRALADPDLAGLWAAPQGAAVRARIAELAPRWAAAAREGVRVLLWADGRGPALRAALVPGVLRVGVYQPATRRFVPLAPAVSGSIAAFVAPRAPFALVASGDVDDCDMDMCPRLRALEARLFALDGTGALLAHARYPRAGAASLPFGAYEIDADAVRLSGDDLSAGGSGEVAFALSSDGGVAPRGDAAARRAPGALGYLDVVGRGGVAAGFREPGYAVRNGALETPDHRALPLGLAHPATRDDDAAASVTIAPGGHAAAVTLVATGCDCGHGRFDAVPAHEIVRVDLTTGAAERVASGGGVGAARFDAAGALYVQQDRALFAVREAGRLEPLPPRLVLVPGQLRTWSCCGL